MSMPSVDVVVLTWNDPEDAKAAVESALASVGVSVRAFVVDNGSSPPFQPESTPDAVVHRSERNLGVGGGRNLGAGLGSAEFICFLDSDAILAADALLEMSREMAAPDVGLVAPVFVGQSAEISAGREPSIGRKIARGLGLTDRYAPTRRDSRADAWDVEFAIGACQLVRRVAFLETDGLDDSALFGPEDVDFCLRLRAAGWRVRQTRNAACHHVARRSSRRLLSHRGLAHARALVRHYWKARTRRRVL